MNEGKEDQKSLLHSKRNRHMMEAKIADQRELD